MFGLGSNHLWSAHSHELHSFSLSRTLFFFIFCSFMCVLSLFLLFFFHRFLAVSSSSLGKYRKSIEDNNDCQTQSVFDFWKTLFFLSDSLRFGTFPRATPPCSPIFSL